MPRAGSSCKEELENFLAIFERMPFPVSPTVISAISPRRSHHALIGRQWAWLSTALRTRLSRGLLSSAR